MVKSMKFLAAPALAFMLTLGAATAEDAPTADTVVATVNGKQITLGQMILTRQALPAQYAKLPNDLLFRGILDQLVHQELLEQSVKGDTPAEVRIALENERRSLMAARAIDAALKTSLTEDAIQAAYQEKYVAAQPDTEYHAAHILVETEDEAKAVVEALDGGADFAVLAKEKSTGPSGPNGGDLGWFGKGMMVAPFEEAVIGMEPGTISAPVQTQFGWHVISLIETRLTKAPALDDVRGEITDELQTTLIAEHLEALKQTATIDRSAESSFDPAILQDTSLVE